MKIINLKELIIQILSDDDFFEKNERFFSVGNFKPWLKTRFPLLFFDEKYSYTINISFENMDFRNFPLYFYWICLPGS